MHVPRILIPLLFSFLLAGAAAAQPPVDYTILCDGAIIGAASFVDGELRVALVEDWTCDGEVSVAQHEDLVVTIVEVDGVWMLAIGDGGPDDPMAFVEEVPSQAIAGMVTAQERRAPAFAREARGHEQSAAAIEEHRPSLPEAAGGGRP